ADLSVMQHDAEHVREGRPTALISLTQDPTSGPVLAWVREQVRTLAAVQ
ncbi:MAG: urease accessory protein UreG, partial [Rhodococcus sp. (in: high G+C Gram-positive bacteria)]